MDWDLFYDYIGLDGVPCYMANMAESMVPHLNLVIKKIPIHRNPKLIFLVSTNLY
jgi:hypothetical protein